MKKWSPDNLIKAWDLATMAHHGQTYGGKTEGTRIDYLNHIGSVVMEVLWCLQNCSKNLDPYLALNCAVLHDIIEDTEYTYNDLFKIFGQEIADGVLALSKDDKTPLEERLAESIARIKLQPYEIWIVKMADRITNLYHPPYYWTKEKIISYRDESLLIYNELHPADPMIGTRLLEKIREYSTDHIVERG